MDGTSLSVPPQPARNHQDPLKVYEDAIDAIASACSSHLAALTECLGDADAGMAAAVEKLKHSTDPLPDPDGVYRAIVFLTDKGRTEDALNVATVAMMQSPTDHRFSVAAAMCHQALQRPEQAIPLYLASLLVRPTAAASYGYGRCQLAAGNAEAARTCFEAAIELANTGDEQEIAGAAQSALAALDR